MLFQSRCSSVISPSLSWIKDPGFVDHRDPQGRRVHRPNCCTHAEKQAFWQKCTCGRVRMGTGVVRLEQGRPALVFEAGGLCIADRLELWSRLAWRNGCNSAVNLGAICALDGNKQENMYGWGFVTMHPGMQDLVSPDELF